MVDPLRHLVAEFIFFNVFKFVIKTSSYQMFLFDGEDIYILCHCVSFARPESKLAALYLVDCV